MSVRESRLDALFRMPVLAMAPALLGWVLTHQTADGTASGIIVEVEAYRGPEDQAAHSRNGRRTERVRAMYGPPGHAYVFSIYGMHRCVNVVAGPEGIPHAVLLRALQPLNGLTHMARRRYQVPAVIDRVATWEDRFGASLARVWTAAEDRPPAAVRGLSSGPARLTQALGIGMEQYGWSLATSPLRLSPPLEPQTWEVATGPRIGVEYAGAWSRKPWRFWVRGNPFVSR